MHEAGGAQQADEPADDGRTPRAGRVGDDTIDRPECATIEIAVGSVAGLRSMRNQLGAALAGVGWPSDRILDAQIVLGELATNAFIHDGAPQFRVTAQCTSDDVEMVASHAGTDTPPLPGDTVVADRTDPTGRGLSIIDQLVADRQVTYTDGVVSTVARLVR